MLFAPRTLPLHDVEDIVDFEAAVNTGQPRAGRRIHRTRGGGGSPVTWLADYAPHVEPLHRALGPEQVQVVIYYDFRAHAAGVFARSSNSWTCTRLRAAHRGLNWLPGRPMALQRRSLAPRFQECPARLRRAWLTRVADADAPQYPLRDNGAHGPRGPRRATSGSSPPFGASGVGHELPPWRSPRTAHLERMPDFLILGAPKSGTTAMYGVSPAPRVSDAL